MEMDRPRKKSILPAQLGPCSTLVSLGGSGNDLMTPTCPVGSACFFGRLCPDSLTAAGAGGGGASGGAQRGQRAEAGQEAGDQAVVVEGGAHGLAGDGADAAGAQVLLDGAALVGVAVGRHHRVHQGRLPAHLPSAQEPTSSNRPT